MRELALQVICVSVPPWRNVMLQPHHRDTEEQGQ